MAALHEFGTLLLSLTRVGSAWRLSSARVHGKKMILNSRSENSPKENYSEFSDRSGGRKSGVRVPPARADWLIAVCHSDLGDTSIVHMNYVTYSIA